MQHQYHQQKDITTLPQNHIFVFSSNLNGQHHSHSARVAQQHFGAIHGIKRGWSGKSFALLMHDEQEKLLPIETLLQSLFDFYLYATNHQSTLYMMSYFIPFEQISQYQLVIDLLKKMPINVIFPDYYQSVLN